MGQIRDIILNFSELDTIAYNLNLNRKGIEEFISEITNIKEEILKYNTGKAIEKYVKECGRCICRANVQVISEKH